jgi:hypothetical protein
MRTWLAVGAGVLSLVGSIDAAEARARIRLPLGRTVALQRPSMPAPTTALPVQTGSVSRVGYRPAIVITPGQAAVAAAATAAPIAAASDVAANAEPTPKLQRVTAPPAPPSPRIQEVRAVAPPCGAGKRVGGIDREDAGFCLIN